MDNFEKRLMLETILKQLEMDTDRDVREATRVASLTEQDDTKSTTLDEFDEDACVGALDRTVEKSPEQVERADNNNPNSNTITASMDGEEDQDDYPTEY